MRTTCLILLLTLCVLAQTPKPDPGLTVLGAADTFTDKQGDQLVMMAFKTKYQEPVVGMYFTAADGSQVRYYMNAAAWDTMKQTLIKARDQWDTLTPDTFKTYPAVSGYRIANRVAVVRYSIQGATDIGPKFLLISAEGGPAREIRVSINLSQNDLKNLVEDFYQVDGFFRAGGN